MSGSNDNTVQGNFISECDDGIILVGGATSVSRNTIQENTIVNSKSDGIKVLGGFDDTIGSTDNKIINNNVFRSVGNGISLTGFPLFNRTIVSGNIVNGNEEVGILVVRGSSHILESNTVTSNSVGIQLGAFITNLPPDGTVVIENVVVGNTNGNIVDFLSNNTVLAGNIIDEDQ